MTRICSECKEKIEEGKPAFFHGQIVCQWCYDNFKKRPLNRKSYVKWVMKMQNGTTKQLKTKEKGRKKD
jgi:hypothetical protein